MQRLVALGRALRSGLLAARNRRISAKPLHLCYALATDGDRLYADLITISASSVRRIYPACKITVLTDDQSLRNAWRALQHLVEVGAQIRSVGNFKGSPRLRSRFVKTQVRNVIDGNVLYLDADTAAVREFDDLLECKAPLSAAIDRNRVYPGGGFPARVAPDFERMGWPHPTRLYLNAGIVMWRDCNEAHALGQFWHENWLQYTKTVDNPSDQPAFNHSIESLGIEPAIMDDVFNARVGISPQFAKGARIYHLLSGEERANGTFIDGLLARYRRDGRIDFRLIKRVAARDHPWIDADGAPTAL